MARRLASWFVVGGSVAWAIAVGWLASNGAIEIDVELYLIASAAALIIGWICVLIWTGNEVGWRRRVVCSVPLLWILGTIFVQTNLPLTARLWISEQQVRNHAEVAEPDPRYSLPRNRVVGWFEITRVSRHGDSVLLQTDFTGFEQVGIAFAPTQPPRSDSGERLYFSHLYGPWYRYERQTKSDY